MIAVIFVGGLTLSVLSLLALMWTMILSCDMPDPNGKVGRGISLGIVGGVSIAFIALIASAFTN
jgi:hypothetical protein